LATAGDQGILKRKEKKMKKVLLIVTTVTLALAMLSLPAMADLNGTIEKELSQSEAILGDHITVTLHVTDGVVGQTVVDTLPDPLKYIDGTLNVTGGNATCKTSEGEIVCTLAENATYTITFDVQVVEVQAEAVNATNWAYLYDGTTEVDSHSANITLHPYEGFEKVATIVYEDNPNGEIEVGELVTWNMTITVPNNFAWNITDAVLKDNLGGELGMAGDEVDNDRDKPKEVDEGDWGDLAPEYNTIPDGDLTFKTPGKSNKVHFWIEEIDITTGDSLNFVLGIFTDRNPSKWGQQCYTSTYENHPLNSGATLKFTDPDTGLQLSAHTCPILIDVVSPISP
jgi:hypothetical protein